MLLRLLARSLTRDWKRKALVVAAISLGASLAAAMLNISLDVGDKMSKELKRYGANLVVTSKLQAMPIQSDGLSEKPSPDELLDEKALSKTKTIFWRNNVVGFAPFLETGAKPRGTSFPTLKVVGTWFNKRLVIPTGETVTSSVRAVRPWWNVIGRSPNDDAEEAVIGRESARRLRARPADSLALEIGPDRRRIVLRIVGILDGGQADDEAIFVPLSVVQGALGLSGKVERIEVSALTTPDNELAKKAEKDPESLTSREFETWYCTAYVSSIAYQLEEAIPGSKAKAVRQVSDSEGAVLSKIQALMWLLTGVALVSSALGISSLMTTAVLERREEMGLEKALGAENVKIIALFLSEGAIQGLIGSLLGSGIGIIMAKMVGRAAFEADISVKGFAFPVTALISVLVVWISSSSAISAIVKLSPKEVLHGR